MIDAHPLDDLLRALARLVRRYLPPKRPGTPRAILLREDGNVLIYTLQLPPAGAPDVVTRELSVFVNGGETPRDVLPASDGMELSFHDNDIVTLVLVDIDDAGNRSEPSPALNFTAADTIAPPAPGELGVTLLREE